jgi:hypothetical protein
MTAPREELVRLVEELPDNQVPAVLDIVHRHRRAAENWPWPPAWFAARETRTTDVAARSAGQLGGSFGFRPDRLLQQPIGGLK